MITSPEINQIAAALAHAQGEMGGATRDSANPFFKSKYADLTSVMDACRGPLSKHGIAVVQSPSATGAVVSLDTLLIHTSGQWIRGTATATAKDESPQSVGSAITYLRRYALQSFAGVTPEDDDAEAAQGRPSPKVVASGLIQHPAGYLAWLDGLHAVAQTGTAALQDAWKASSTEFRFHLTTTAPDKWETLKAIAARMVTVSRTA